MFDLDGVFCGALPTDVVAFHIGDVVQQDFDPAAIKKSSVACEALCMWFAA